MSHFALQLLGPFQATLDGQPLAGFESNKVRALLTFLAVEADRPHSRDELIGLLWPDQPDTAARANLRQALANLRQAIGDRTTTTPFLIATFDSVQFQRSEHCGIDVVTFTGLIAACRTHAHRRLETCRSCAQHLQQAAELYRGDFLAQFVQSGSEAFEEWALIQRERLHREALDALYHLSQHFEWRGDYTLALRYARRQLELDPWREEAHRQAMRTLALTEQRSAALAQYESCCRILAEELGAAPAAETTDLYEQIKSSSVTANFRQQSWPTPATPLIGREAELAEANAIWHKARTVEGQVLFISGEPGIGKTRLVHELIAQERYGSVTILLGECFAEGSAPYAPIAQMLQAALDTSDASQNLTGLAPSIIADLITFVPLLRDRFPDVSPNLPLEPQAEQQRRFDSVASFLAALAARRPVVLIVEDVHWADSATLAVLRHIARRLRRAKVLIVATHREVALDETRLFHEWLGDLQRERLATSLTLARLDLNHTRDLLAALFQDDITPEFLDGLYRATEGNPFFITEVCQALIEEGAVYREGEGWQRRSMAQLQIPKSVRLAIQRRIDRLPEAAQDTLQRAAVLGREFEFDVLQAMSDLGEEALIEALETAERAQLIDEVARASRTVQVSFAFVHALIPSTLNEGLRSLRRQRLHRRAAQVIDQIAEQTNQVDEFSARLAQHYSEAGEIDKAIEHWLKAGEYAQRVYAYDEAIAHYQQALALLKEQGSASLTAAARTAMKLGTLYHTLFDFDRAQLFFNEAFGLWDRVREAQSQVHLPPAPHALRMYWDVDAIRTLDPTLCTRRIESDVIDHLFSGLVELTADLDVKPAIARAWQISDRGRRYVFQLRGDVFWSDGTRLSAQDFEFSWKRALQPQTTALYVECLFDIKGARLYHEGNLSVDRVGVRALDEQTLVVELEEATGHFLYVLATSAMYAIPWHVCEACGEKWSAPNTLVTSGPFRVESWELGSSIALVRDPDYWGLYNGNLSRVELTSPPRGASVDRLEMYKADLHDIGRPAFTEIDPTQYRAAYAEEYRSWPMAHVGFLAFDTSQPPFDDARVRQALTHAVDKTALIEAIEPEASTPATGGFVPPGLPGHSPGIGLAYDPNRARRLMYEAGYPGGHGFPRIRAWTSVDDQRIEQYLAAQWRKQLGIEIVWETINWIEYLQRLNLNAPHLYRLGLQVDYPDPDALLRVETNHVIRWRNPQYDQLLETARRMSDQTERLKMYQAADQLLMDEAVIMPLAYFRKHVLIKPWVKRYPHSAVQDNHWKDVIIEPH